VNSSSLQPLLRSHQIHGSHNLTHVLNSILVLLSDHVHEDLAEADRECDQGVVLEQLAVVLVGNVARSDGNDDVLNGGVFGEIYSGSFSVVYCA
jgi:hypothetical protein